ncbi:transposase (plasmid) [Candidatus Methylocalor cossyra]|uniref:Mutator family transposase n=1 Tax=Candidatus Methylocalor cossyra TaxID=3108543 RepID=A0ABM9NMV3_9GAMM
MPSANGFAPLAVATSARGGKIKPSNDGACSDFATPPNVRRYIDLLPWGAGLSIDELIGVHRPKYPKAVACLEKDRDALLTFCDFPAEHWIHLRTTNPIESTFATVRLRTDKTRGCVSRETILAMVFMLVKSAERHWRKLNGIPRLAQVIEGVVFKDGVREDAEKIAA